MQSTPYHAGEHVPEAGLRPPTDRCPACGSSAPRAAVFRIQDAPRVDLLQCEACGIASASRMPTDAWLTDYYSRYYSADDAPNVTFSGLARFGRHIARVAPARARLTVLDFGGGDGALALSVAAHLGADHVDILVADPTPARTDAPEGVTLRSVPSLDDVSGTFDLVIASAILEHVPDLETTIPRLFAAVAPGGAFYARTPYWLPIARRFGADLTFPGHVHDMGPPFWNRVCDTFPDAGLRLLRSAPSIVETTLRQDPIRTLAAAVLKAPSHLEVKVRGDGWTRPWWGFVGGWEVVLAAPAPAAAAPPATASRTAEGPT